MWEQYIGCLKVDECYSLVGLVVRSFGEEAYLSMPKEGCVVEECSEV